MSYDEVSDTMKDNIQQHYIDENATDEFTRAWNRYQVQVGL